MKLTNKFSGVKVFDIINRYNIETVEQAQALTDEQLLKCRHVGPLFIKKLRSIQTEQPEAQKPFYDTTYRDKKILDKMYPEQHNEDDLKKIFSGLSIAEIFEVVKEAYRLKQQNQPQPEKAQEEQSELWGEVLHIVEPYEENRGPIVYRKMIDCLNKNFVITRKHHD